MDDMEQKIKQKLLESLIEHMHDKMGSDLESKFPKKAVEVSVEAPDDKHPVEGLDHAKEVTGGLGSLADMPDGDEGSDEDRLMALLDDDKDEGDDDEKRG